jgi:UDP-N-acetylmuramyl pentapeptide phosphotransferase/UDP-N-acetylglucosamine-1-phosphate transferase
MNTTVILAFAFIFTIIAFHFARPYLPRAAVNERSAHIIPTPQGAGVVIFAVLFITHMSAYTGLAFALSLIGFIDDWRGLGVKTRLLAQGIAAAIALYLLAPSFPLWLMPLLYIGLIWNINLTNFMDGMDGISILQGLTIALGVIAARIFGFMPEWAFFLALALIACLLGFIPFNKPKAKVFMGDAGALPLGLLTGILLIAYAERAGVIPALILTLYYASDSGITLLMRLKRRENLSTGHKSHFYQQAMQKGMSVYQILSLIAGANILLIALSLYAIHAPFIALTLAILAVAGLLRCLARP